MRGQESKAKEIRLRDSCVKYACLPTGDRPHRRVTLRSLSSDCFDRKSRSSLVQSSCALFESHQLDSRACLVLAELRLGSLLCQQCIAGTRDVLRKLSRTKSDPRGHQIQSGYKAIIAKVGLSGSKSSYGFDVSLGCTFYLVCTRAVGVRFQVSLSDFDATYSQSWSRGQLFGSRNCRLRIVIFVLALRQGRDRGPRIRRYFRKKE